MLAPVTLTAALAMASPAPLHALPPCLRGPFRGITATLATGEVIGEPDRDDWGCIGRAGRSARDLGMTTEDVPIPPPTQVCFGPAFPNPATGGTKLRFTLPRRAVVRLEVYGQPARGGPARTFLVRTLVGGEFQPGVHEVRWDLADDGGLRVDPGLYRAVLIAEGKAICGDIQVP